MAVETHMRVPIAAVLLVTACASNPMIRRVQEYRDARARGDVAAEASYLAPDARMFYEERKGDGEPLTAGRGGRYAHWDDYFHSTSTLTDWTLIDGGVRATVHETNDFYRLLDWKPVPYTMTWWLDDAGRVTAALVKGGEGKATSRMDEFKSWAEAHHPDELRYLMPNGRIDPTGDRPERWRAILEEWRRQ